MSESTTETDGLPSFTETQAASLADMPDVPVFNAESDAIRLVKVTGKCPHCEVRKHQISGTEEHAVRVVGDAIERHVAEAHPDGGED